jgi:hypothetical protein
MHDEAAARGNGVMPAPRSRRHREEYHLRLLAEQATQRAAE